MSYDALCSSVVADCILGNWNEIFQTLGVTVVFAFLAGTMVGIVNKALHS